MTLFAIYQKHRISGAYQGLSDSMGLNLIPFPRGIIIMRQMVSPASQHD